MRTLGVDWAAQVKPIAWWAAHGSHAKPYGLRMAAPLCGDGPLEDLVFLYQM